MAFLTISCSLLHLSITVGLNKSQQRLHCEVREDATDEHKRFLSYNKYVISKCRKNKKQKSH